MKKYMKPETVIAHIQTATMIAVSPGVSSGNAVGKSYSASDVTYSRGRNSDWDDED